MCADGMDISACCRSYLIQQIVEKQVFHAAHAVAADLFLVHNDRHDGFFRILKVEDSGHRRISADAVVMPVAGNQTAVKTDVAGAVSGNGGKLGAEEILLGKAVLVVQYFKKIELF